MLHIETQPTQTPVSPPTTSAILVIGGAEDKVHGREILRTFWRRAGGNAARIAIVPSASREPTIIGERYRSIFTNMGVRQLEVLDIRDRDQCEDDRYMKFVETCTGTFLTGGDQLRLCALLADTPLMERLRLRVQRGEVTLAGTSAGAAVMGHHMIAGGSSGESPNRALVDMATGLGIIPEAIVDQHFHNRNRFARLLSALSMHPDRIGIGIDEDTCAVVEHDSSIEVVGRGTVTIVDPAKLSGNNCDRVGTSDPLSLHDLRLHVLCHGNRYHLRTRQPLS
ncbi:cyanophycinase [Rubidibacter lacunae KORDI 51-2]|uniref:Cyanophycinase n=1 Tax=Rubidibacter lacunae KORDI 51-2 TaxID=582515 RepID=U5DPJ7_9CHRO|nr:cyanophycinase [Rubidibacter lacunae]ERN42529.1 cyanophycinase [Rubidibacter lacunae KORDI 51-2]